MSRANKTIQATRPAWTTSGFDFGSEGRQLGSLRFPPWREAGTLRLGDEELEITKSPGLLTNDFRLTRRGATLARASRKSWFSSRFRVEIDGRSYEVRMKPSAFLRDFEVWNDRERIGTIRSVSRVNQDSVIELAESLGLEEKLFLFSLSRFLRMRWQYGFMTAIVVAAFSPQLWVGLAL